MSARTPTPIESFGPELFNALIQGSKQRFEISSIPYRDAVKFRHRCHQLRHRMRLDQHPLATVAAKTRISIEWDTNEVETLYNRRRVPYPKSPDSKVSLIIEPHDSEFRNALKAAGLDVDHRIDPEAGMEAPAIDTSNKEGPPPSLDKLLGDL